MQKTVTAVLLHCASAEREMRGNYSTVSDSPRIFSDLSHSQSHQVHYEIYVKAKLENFI